MKGLQRVVDRLRIEPVAKGGGHPIAPPLLHGPPMVCQTCRQRRRAWWPRLGGASAPGRSRCRPPRAHAVMGQHDVVSGPAQPARLRAPGEGRRAAAPRACTPTMALAAGQGVPCDTPGMDRRSDGGRRPMCWPRRCRAAAARGGHLHHAPACPALADVGIRSVSRREGRGRGATGAWEGHAERGGPSPCTQA